MDVDLTPKRDVAWLDDDLAASVSTHMPPFKQRRVCLESEEEEQHARCSSGGGAEEEETSTQRYIRLMGIDDMALREGEAVLPKIKAWEEQWLATPMFANNAALSETVADLFALWKAHPCRSWERCYADIRENICVAALALHAGFLADRQLTTENTATVAEMCWNVSNAATVSAMCDCCADVANEVILNDALMKARKRDTACRDAFNFLATFEYLLLLGMNVFGLVQ